MKNYNDCGCGKGGNDWTFSNKGHDHDNYCGKNDSDFYGEYDQRYQQNYDYSYGSNNGYQKEYNDNSCSCHDRNDYDYDMGGKKEREHSCPCEHERKERDSWCNHEHKECDCYSFQPKNERGQYGRKDEHCAKVYTLSKHENKRDCHDDKGYGYDVNGKKERDCDHHQKERDCDFNEGKREREFTCLCHCKICIPPFPFRCNK